MRLWKRKSSTAEIALTAMAAAARTRSTALSLLLLSLAWSASARRLQQSSKEDAYCYVQLRQQVCVLAFSNISLTQCKVNSQQSGLDLKGDGDTCFASLPLSCSAAIAWLPWSFGYQFLSCGDSVTREVQANSDTFVQAAGETLYLG